MKSRLENIQWWLHHHTAADYVLSGIIFLVGIIVGIWLMKP